MSLDLSAITADFFEKLEIKELDEIAPEEMSNTRLESKLPSDLIKIETICIPNSQPAEGKMKYPYLTIIYKNSWDGWDALARTPSTTLHEALLAHFSALYHLKEQGF